MLNYVTDTHSLVWYFTDDQYLSKKALKSFESTVKEGQIMEGKKDSRKLTLTS